MGVQAAVAVPDEGGTITVHSATQSLDAVQRAVANTLGVAHHQVLGPVGISQPDRDLPLCLLPHRI